MPEVGDAFIKDDFSQFYRLDNDATINKLRGVKGISMNKYELSKFLGKYRAINSLVDDKGIKKFTRILGKMFNNRELIENFILWERIFEIFIADADYDGFIRFAKRIVSAIDRLSVSNDEQDIGASAVKHNLRRHLVATLNRVLSLLWGKNADRIINALGDLCLDGSLRRSYIKTCMSNKYAMAVPNEILESPVEKEMDEDINFTDFASSFSYLCKKERSVFDVELLPYFRQAQDVASAMLLKSICSECNAPLDIDDYANELKTSDFDVPIEILTDTSPNACKIVSVKGGIKDKLRVAIANVDVAKVSDLDSVLKGRKQNRTYERYEKLANLVNTAIKENADMLVLPENYIPFEWLSSLAAKAAREGLAIVTGVEHIVVRREVVYNFTAVLLPFKFFNSIPTAAMFFQLKKYYAPEERRVIEGYRARPPHFLEKVKRPLYHWSDCYFPVYCCYELASIADRSEFMSWSDMVVAVEHNKDIHYFSSIVESLARDLHCYFVQVNTSPYGDSRITQPTRSEVRNLITVKGGLNQSLLIGELDIHALREFQIKEYSLQKDGGFKPTPPGMNIDTAREKIDKRRKTLSSV